MFYSCNILTNLNLSNFNTQNITKMGGIFYGCESLTYLNLSNFKTQHVTNMIWVFYGCNSLKKDKIITKDNKLLKQLNNKIVFK